MIASIILAAGKGTRMKSKKPKVLHQIAGKPLLWHVCKAASDVGVDETVIVVGYKGDEVKEALGDSYKYALQAEQLGTGHAVMEAEEYISDDIDTVLVLSGDAPLLTEASLKKLVQHHKIKGLAATVLSAIVPDATNYGRIVRDNGLVKKIVEEKDASPEERSINEINSGIYCFNKQLLFKALKKIKPENKQGEYYLTDVIEILVKDNHLVDATAVEGFVEILGINDRVQLSEAEQVLRTRINTKVMENGVTLIDPDATYIEASVQVGLDTIIYPFSYLRGDTVIGEDCIIGPGTILENTIIGSGTEIKETTAVDAQIGENCKIGPFSYLRPGTELGANVRIGDFVEIKNTQVGHNSKIPHLSYIGDSAIGEGVNVGAGTITCNYDGKNKWQTTIEDKAFIGSNTNLVAPVIVGKNAMIGAGSTITKDIPANALAIARGKQKNILNGAAKKKQS